MRLLLLFACFASATFAQDEVRATASQLVPMSAQDHAELVQARQDLASAQKALNEIEDRIRKTAIEESVATIKPTARGKGRPKVQEQTCVNVYAEIRADNVVVTMVESTRCVD